MTIARESCIIMRRASRPDRETSYAVSSGLRAVLDAPGRLLGAQTRSTMERRFNHDFSRVRVHTGAPAAASVESLDAQAFTVARDIVFGPGRYAPHTSTGEALLAHELAHVVEHDESRVPSNGLRKQTKGKAVEPAVANCDKQDVVLEAARWAGEILSAVNRLLQSGGVSIPEDPRGRTPLQDLYMDYFKVEPGPKSNLQILTIKEYFGLLERALAGATFECRGDDDTMCVEAGKMSHSAYAAIGAESKPTLRVCPAFFGKEKDEQAVTIIHELAHARLSANHKGGMFSQFECAPTPVKSFEQAIDNAYVYGSFVRCLLSKRTREEPGPSQPAP